MTAPKTDAPHSIAASEAPEQSTADADTVGDSDAQRKRLANVSAHLCRAGYALHHLSCGGYLIARWDRSTYAPDLRCAEAFLAQVTGRRA